MPDDSDCGKRPIRDEPSVRIRTEAGEWRAAFEHRSPSAAGMTHCSDPRERLQMKQHGLRRPLWPEELSDGALRYLMPVAALLSPQPTALMVLNEPETIVPNSTLALLCRAS